MQKVTDMEIIKALECCSEHNTLCDGCSYKHKTVEYCDSDLCKDAIALIKRQKAEIERLKKFLDMSRKVSLARRDSNLKICELNLKLIEELKTAKSKAINEFAEELKTRIKNAVFCCYDLRFKNHLQELLKIIVAKIDNLVKEMTEQKE